MFQNYEEKNEYYFHIVHIFATPKYLEVASHWSYVTNAALQPRQAELMTSL